MVRITVERLTYLKDRFQAVAWDINDTTGVMTILTRMEMGSLLMWAETIRTGYDYRYVGMSESPDGMLIRFGL